MQSCVVKETDLVRFKTYLRQEEKSGATVEKYVRDVKKFFVFCENEVLTKSIIIAYKEKLCADGYAVRSINSMLASINSFFSFLGWLHLKVKLLKVQKEAFSTQEQELSKEEYLRLCETARCNHNERLALVLQTICCTGIRVSELRFITVNAVKNGEAIVSCKGKIRKVFIVKALRKKLLCYAKSHNIHCGMIFVTRSGNSLDRTSIWRQMKALCATANVDPQKVFPHNLRHLFARLFYRVQKDIAKLADILGHSNINTTRIYIKTTGEEHRRIMEKMQLLQ